MTSVPVPPQLRTPFVDTGSKQLQGNSATPQGSTPLSIHALQPIAGISDTRIQGQKGAILVPLETASNGSRINFMSMDDGAFKQQLDFSGLDPSITLAKVTFDREKNTTLLTLFKAEPLAEGSSCHTISEVHIDNLTINPRHPYKVADSLNSATPPAFAANTLLTSTARHLSSHKPASCKHYMSTKAQMYHDPTKDESVLVQKGKKISPNLRKLFNQPVAVEATVNRENWFATELPPKEAIKQAKQTFLQKGGDQQLFTGYVSNLLFPEDDPAPAPTPIPKIFGQEKVAKAVASYFQSPWLYTQGTETRSTFIKEYGALAEAVFMPIAQFAEKAGSADDQVQKTRDFITDTLYILGQLKVLDAAAAATPHSTASASHKFMTHLCKTLKEAPASEKVKVIQQLQTLVSSTAQRPNIVTILARADDGATQQTVAKGISEQFFTYTPKDATHPANPLERYPLSSIKENTDHPKSLRTLAELFDQKIVSQLIHDPAVPERPQVASSYLGTALKGLDQQLKKATKNDREIISSNLDQLKKRLETIEVIKKRREAIGASKKRDTLKARQTALELNASVVELSGSIVEFLSDPNNATKLQAGIDAIEKFGNQIKELNGSHITQQEVNPAQPFIVTTTER